MTKITLAFLIGLSNLALGYHQTVPLSRHYPDVEITLEDDGANPRKTHLVVVDGHQMIELTSEVENSLNCDFFPGAKVAGFLLSNLHLSENPSPSAFAEYEQPIRMRLSLFCQLGEDTIQVVSKELHGNILLDKTVTLAPVQNPGFRMIDCLLYPKECH